MLDMDVEAVKCLSNDALRNSGSWALLHSAIQFPPGLERLSKKDAQVEQC